jgi:hypothetical protein
MSQGRRISTFDQRVDWLKAHPEFRQAELRATLLAMKRDGLIAPGTYWRDVSFRKEFQAVGWSPPKK